MNQQVQLWMPAILALFGTLTVVITAWLHARAVTSQIDAVRGEMKQGFAEQRLEFHKDFSDLARRVERIEEQRSLVRP